MNGVGNTEREFQTELQELLGVARGMTEGNFHRMVNIKARGVVGDLASYINQVLRNLQRIDPVVKGSSREIPKVAKHLAEIIQTTEDATNRVLEQTEHLLDEQTKIEQGLSRSAEMLRHAPGDPMIAECRTGLEGLKEMQRRSQGRAMDIMSAMEFQDLTTQKIQKLITLVADVEDRLVQLLVLFRIEDATEKGNATDPIVETCAQDGSALCDQSLVDQILQGFRVGRP